jgi:hypothetical protein
MPYRPRELAIRAREAATFLLRTLDRNEMVGRFLDMYAAEFRRPGRADQPGHYREQMETIRREAVLAMVLRIEAAMPARMKVSVTVRGMKKPAKSKVKKGKSATKPKRQAKPTIELAIPLLDMFREEFFVALGQALEWKEEDAQGFWRDLELYEALTEKESSRAKGSAKKGTVLGGPFVDRVGLLLDPSLMDQSRRAAAKFQGELNDAADRVLRDVFSRNRAN